MVIGKMKNNHCSQWLNNELMYVNLSTKVRGQNLHFKLQRYSSDIQQLKSEQPQDKLKELMTTRLNYVF